jgi:penicillin-binding protein 2
MVHRFTLFILFFAVLIGIVVIRLWFLQVAQGKKYEAMAYGNRIRKVSIEAQRGYILDRNGVKMVVNRLALSIFVVPTDFEELEDKEAKVAELASLLDLDPEEIMKKLEGEQVQPHKPVLIKKDVDPGTWFFIKERQNEYPWVQATELPVRDYPPGEETRAAHVLGYLGEISNEQLKQLEEKGYKAGDIVGTSGVEAYYEDTLRGVDGWVSIEVNARGLPLRQLEKVDPVPGNTLVLTIDRNLQKVVEESLASGMKLARTYFDKERGMNYAATAGAVVVLDPKNGEVLAMASEPTFNLEKFVGGIDEQEWKELNDPSKHYPLNNRAIVGQYPPGSTFKVVTALAALQEGLTTAYTTFTCNHVFNEGEFKDYPKTCWGTHGRIDFINGIIQSCDVVFYHLGYQFYNRGKNLEWENRLQEYARLMGLGSKTGIDLPNEFEGRVPTPQWKKEFNRDNPDYQQWYPGDTVNMAVGQGDILLTPLQLANLYAAIANRGPFFRPHLGKEILTWQGDSIKQIEPEKMGDLTDPNNPLGIMISRNNIEVVRNALTGVVQGRGTAASTFAGFPLNQIPVAGKTGTAEIAGRQPTAWFACYAPANDPKYVVVVMLEEGGHGGLVAAPIARRIIEYLFNLPFSPLLPSGGD